MKIIINKIIGICVYTGHGQDWNTITHQKNTKIGTEDSFEIVLDEQEWNTSTVSIIEDGKFLLLFTSIGDEQPQSTMYILKDFSIEQIEQEIPAITMENVGKLFGTRYHYDGRTRTDVSNMPDKLIELLLSI